jgi:Phosphotransferase enzyme family
VFGLRKNSGLAWGSPIPRVLFQAKPCWHRQILIWTRRNNRSRDIIEKFRFSSKLLVKALAMRAVLWSNIYEMENLLKCCIESNKLHPTLRRHIHRVGDHVIKIPLKLGETDLYNNTHDPRLTAVLDENAIAATRLVERYTSIPVPKIVHEGEVFTVWEYIDGIPMDMAWKKLSGKQIESIKLQLRGFIAQLWTIQHPSPSKFAVGTLCSTHELLNDPFLPNTKRDFYSHNGPFKSIEEYKSNVELLYGRVPRFSTDAKLLFDHMDWHPSNVILHHNLDTVAAVIDWERAGFIPDPQEMYEGDDPIEEWGRPQLADLFRGIQ